MLARIYQPARNAMQSGQAKAKTWVLEYSPAEGKTLDPLMGWTGSSDMDGQVRIQFDSSDAAVEFAKGKGIAYQVLTSHKRKANVRQGGYGDNFANGRKTVWTH